MEKHERYYNIFRLNRLFAISSIVFFLLLVWTFTDDYGRGWKDHQKEFRKLEIARTSGLLHEEIERLSTLEEYHQVERELAKTGDALKEKKDALGDLDSQLRQIEARLYKTEQEHSFIKAEHDVAKYLYEDAVGRNDHSAGELKEDLDVLEKKMVEHQLQLEQVQRRLKQKKNQKRSHEGDLQEVKDRYSTFNRQRDVLTRKLASVDPAAMSLANRIANRVRDLPVLDFLSPYYKIDQVVLNDVTEDMNFVQVPRVDRCTTCHLGIARPGYEAASQPYATHPNLELYLSSGSPHPLESFGCTACHAGRGRGTDFASSAHSPESPGQAKKWAQEYGWYEMSHWDQPMYPVKNTEAGCFKCHSEEIFLRGARKLNLGTNLIERAGCFGCHAIERYEDKRRIGPDLNKIASKASPDWTYLWIKNPKSFRHNSWMPSFFHLSNNSDPGDKARTDQEIHAIVHYLFKRSSEFPLDGLPGGGDAGRGKELVNSLGCLGCHRIESEPIEEQTALQTLRRDHGPNLIGLGSKTTPRWVFNWLKQPERYFPETKMPNLRLSDREAADMTSYLITLENEGFLQENVPPLDETEVDLTTFSFLRTLYSDFDSRQKLAAMSLDDKLNYSGERLIRHYGCFGCHNIPGFENEKPIGTELTEEGSKSVEKFDFGLLQLDHTRQAWFTQKLRHPRSFDLHKVKGPYEKLRMPHFDFSEAEVEAIVTALLGFVKTSYGVKPVRSENPDVHMGQWLVREYNCQGCHVIERDGGAVRRTVTQWIMDVNGISEEEAAQVTVDFSPPDLNTQGAKTQPDWLFDFLKNPDILIRPNLKVRMPTFHLTDSEWNSIMKYFQFLEGEVNAYESPHTLADGSEIWAAGKKLEQLGECNKCHFYGAQFPLQGPETWAPNLALVKDRLRPDWVFDWLKDPQAILPGTKMPRPYIPTEEDLASPGARKIFGREIMDLGGNHDAMIQGLRDYLYTIEGKRDITKELKNYFEENGYQFFKVEEEEEWDEWDE